MATKRQFEAELAKHKGASLDAETADFDFHVDAPDGFIWAATGCAVITEPHSNGMQSWKCDAYAALIDAMKDGLRRDE